MQYTQIKYEERIELSELYSEGLSINRIAQLMNRSKSTISRELKRNKTYGNYWPDSAHSFFYFRRRRGNKITRNDDLNIFIIQKLVYKRWSPEQIAGWLKVNKPSFGVVSHETIYKWIYLPDQIHSGSRLWRYLTRHKRKRGLKRTTSAVSRIPNRVSIHDRPKDVEGRAVFGHWEGDLMSFMNNSQYMLVLHERKSLYVKSCVLENKQASTTKKALIELMKSISSNGRKTLTLDNGGEFAEHEGYKEIGLNSYFCDPYSSWQKGGVENSNGRLRTVLPRSTDIKSIKLNEFNKIIDNHNSTPRKSLGWMTPEQVFAENICA